MTGNVVDAIHLELSADGIHRLGQSVGEEEDGGARTNRSFFQHESPLRHNTNRDIRLTMQFADISTKKQRSIVAGIAVMQVARRQVEHTDEECDEHQRTVHVNHRIVHHFHYLVGLRQVSSDGAEDGSGDNRSMLSLCSVCS